MQTPPQQSPADVQLAPLLPQHRFATVLKPATGWQVVFDGLQAVPAAQHLRATALPQGVLPLGQPHVLRARSAQPTPAAQHAVPQAAWPLAQQQFCAGSTQAPPAGQQAFPQVEVPGGQAASARNGLSTVAATPAATAAPMPLSTLRRDDVRAILRVS
jgi:hypothetical protein